MKFSLILLLIMGQAFAQGYDTYEGLRIHSSCLEVFGNNFPELVSDGFQKGVQCMKALDLENTPRENLSRLEENYRDGKIMVTCQENMGINSFDAHASGRPGQAVPALGLVHPYMSFNADRKDELLSKPGYLGQIAFHESIHHLGYSHEKSIEYAYSCEECCFNDNPEIKEAACKICKSEYRDELLSETYGIDLEKLVNKSKFWNKFGAGRIFRKALLAKPQSLIFRELILDYDLYSNPLSILSARTWKEQFPSEIISSVAIKNIPEQIEVFAGLTNEARTAIFSDKNFPKAVAIYHELSFSPLAELLLVDWKMATRLGQAVLDDMDSIWFQLSEEEQRSLDSQYLELKGIVKTPKS